MDRKEEMNTKTERQNANGRLLFHGSWSSRMLIPGSEAHALVPHRRREQGLAPEGESKGDPIAEMPTLLSHPLLKDAASYRWHSRMLEKEARKVVFSLCSSSLAGWNKQVELAMTDLFRLMDQDRALRLGDSTSSMGLTLERVCRAPIIEDPFEFSYQGSRWLMHPVNEWSEAIPFEAHYSKLLLNKAGCAFDCWYIAEELPKPTLTERVREGAGIAASALGSVTWGVASLLGAAFGALTLLDPALVGTLNSRAEPGQAEWFIIAKWLH